MSIITFGCRVNQADSLVIARISALGVVSAAHRGPVVVVNGTVTLPPIKALEPSTDRSRQSGRAYRRDGVLAVRRRDEVGKLPNVVTIVSNPAETIVERGARRTCQ
jgi:hypothetical protein